MTIYQVKIIINNFVTDIFNKSDQVKSYIMTRDVSLRENPDICGTQKHREKRIVTQYTSLEAYKTLFIGPVNTRIKS